jgi:prepilin-type N-terminal cleavage/methylation domain-containing protein/prepilin-type processing-associated H-X9-DG protein
MLSAEQRMVPSRSVHPPPRRSAFTLVELLVVLGILALLLALLLPALGRTRRVAQSTACMANLRSIGQAMLVYAAENRGAIAGSPLTTGRYLWVDDGSSFKLAAGITSTSSPPPCVDIYDFMGPLARVMQLPVPETTSSVERFRAYRQLRPFLCPANEGVIATKYKGPAALEDGQMLSYCTATGFLLPAFRTAEYSGRAAMPGTPYWTVPASYAPRVDRVGNAASKVYAADSGRWSRYDSAPTFTLDPDADHNSTPFSDFGPFWGITKSFDRSVPNGLNAPALDARIYAYRHGATSPGRPAGEYRMNVVFFDGHVETVDDLAGSDPALWLPRGAVLNNPAASLNSGPLVFPDVAARFITGKPYTVP